jgi:hypothetical protein
VQLNLFSFLTIISLLSFLLFLSYLTAGIVNMATEAQVSSTLSSLFEVSNNDRDLRLEIEEDLFEEVAEVDADLSYDIDFSDVDEGETFKTIQKASEGAHTATTRKGYKG